MADLIDKYMGEQNPKVAHIETEKSFNTSKAQTMINQLTKAITQFYGTDEFIPRMKVMADDWLKNQMPVPAGWKEWVARNSNKKMDTDPNDSNWSDK